MSEIEYKVRDMVEDDLPLIYSSFLKSYKKTWPVSLIPDRVYFKVYHDYLENHLDKCRCLVAHEADDESEICGWALGGIGLLVYVYVKQLWRGYGIASTLIDNFVSAGLPCVHPLETMAGNGLMAKFGVDWKLQPPTANDAKLGAEPPF